METRQFRAKTMSEALRETRKELGADAMIISARTMDGPSGYVEVTAVGNGETKKKNTGFGARYGIGAKTETARESDDIARNFINEEQIQKSIEPLKREMMSLRKMIADLSQITSQAVLPGFNDLRTLILESSQEQEASRLLGPIYTELLELGLLPDIARDLVRTAEMKLGLKAADRKDWMNLARGMVRELITQRIKLSGPMVAGEGSRIFVFAGPSGVGKTTTLAKVASRMALSEGLDVVIITTDTYRVGSIEQSRRYAELIGVPLVVADRPETMATALRSYAHADVLLIDTPGRAFENEQVREMLKDVLAATGEPLETHLLISATYSTSQQEAVIRNFMPMKPSRLIMTKIDECVQLGSLVNIQQITELPFSYLTRGHRVPEDIEVAGAGRIAQLLFRTIME
ncbi:MAG: flagellar biosynthesis protein FlhF [Deltaproteobacteria bacterium]|nr:flagellar biosynthesis protein FlhF [Deltaproteobacteria bacterium]